MRVNIPLTVARATLIIPASVRADLITFEFSGTVSGGMWTQPRIVTIGDHFVGHFTYDLGLQLSGGNGQTEAWDPSGILGFEMSFFAAGTGELLTAFDAGPMDGDGQDLFRVINAGDDYLILRDKDDDVDYKLQFRDAQGSVWDDLSVPQSLNLADFEVARFEVDFLGTGLPGVFDANDWGISGDITGLSSTVIPAPGAGRCPTSR